MRWMIENGQLDLPSLQQIAYILALMFPVTSSTAGDGFRVEEISELHSLCWEPTNGCTVPKDVGGGGGGGGEERGGERVRRRGRKGNTHKEGTETMEGK